MPVIGKGFANWGVSSIGRSLASHARGRGIEAPTLHVFFRDSNFFLYFFYILYLLSLVLIFLSILILSLFFFYLLSRYSRIKAISQSGRTMLGIDIASIEVCIHNSFFSFIDSFYYSLEFSEFNCTSKCQTSSNVSIES